jgi:hypothetical protein
MGLGDRPLSGGIMHPLAGSDQCLAADFWLIV